MAQGNMAITAPRRMNAKALPSDVERGIDKTLVNESVGRRKKAVW